MVSEMLGCFLLVLAYLTQTEDKYKLSSDSGITLMIISGAYEIALQISHPNAILWTQSPLNPAIALSEITFATFDGNIENMHWSWIFFTFGWAGSLLALVMFEYVFKKAADVVEEVDEQEELANEEHIDVASTPMNEM
jgi:glycerol uptake facilitator-like aquaporin